MNVIRMHDDYAIAKKTSPITPHCQKGTFMFSFAPLGFDFSGFPKQNKKQ